MDSMSHDPSASDIGSQLVDVGTQGVSAGTTAATSILSGLIPAGAEEVSAQAVMAFAQEAATMLASNTAAQEELMRAGTALTDIARMYGETDDGAAGSLAVGAAAISNHPLAGGSGARVGAGLLRAGAMAGDASAAARVTPLVSQVTNAASSPMAQAAANAGTSAMSGAAPLGSGMAPGAGASAGGSSKAGLASAAEPADDDEDREGRGEHLASERLV
ncbi:PE family protein [Mycobacterium spongiae]|uniref:PE domain-containing protein n=1 Tax=Mycobacterium spongiae TaxID=886343 RepID=A0A975JXV6_9MYCO|nr:PE family protein [Mycobacterium spongiae]QUR67704.1 PE domain-containing protein [Mycobacterium spongiae]